MDILQTLLMLPKTLGGHERKIHWIYEGSDLGLIGIIL